MTLQKAPLAVAVAAALTLSVQAQADISYTDSPIVISSNTTEGVVIQNQTIDGTLDIDIQQSSLGGGIRITNSNVADTYIENNQGRIESGNTLSAITIENSVVSGAIINEGVIIGEDAGIMMIGIDSEVEVNATGRTYTVKSGLGSFSGDITNNGEIISRVNGIKTEGVDINGNITNNGSINGGNDGIILTGGYEGKDVWQTDEATNTESRAYSFETKNARIQGNITSTGEINSSGSGIEVAAVDMDGNLINTGDITAGSAGIAILGGEQGVGSYTATPDGSIDERSRETKPSSFNGDIINDGVINTERLGGIEVEGTNVTGNITNNGAINGGDAGIIVAGGFTQHTIQDDFATETHTFSSSDESKLASMQGNITNTGEINSYGTGIELEAVDMDGNLNNTGDISSTYGIAVTGGYKEVYAYAETAGVITQDEREEGKGAASSFTGEINNSGTIEADDTGIYIENTVFNGTINNTGTITAGLDGIYIDDSVTGNVVINQKAGAINGGEYAAIRLNKATRVNYTGGQLNGDIENDGGTFHVVGNQTINGDYEQLAGATLSLGLHQETSLTANNIRLAANSEIFIDTRSGYLYLGNGQHTLELLKATEGELIATGVSVESSSALVKIASWKINAAGNLEFVIEAQSVSDVASQAINSGTLTGQAATNAQALAGLIDKLAQSELAQENPEFFDAIFDMLNTNDPVELAAAIKKLLPDVTGTAIASAMSASNMSNGQVSVRARGLASGDTFNKTGIWIQALAADAEQDARDGIAGYDADTRGFVLGLDGELNNGSVVGAAYSFTNTDSDSATSSSDTDYHMLTGYWGQSYGNVLMDGQVYYAWGDNSSRRAIGATADYDSKLYGARIGAGYQLDLGNDAQLIPTLSLDYSRLSVDGYTEQGTGALTIQGEDYDRLELGLAGELNKTYQVNDMLVTPRLTLGVYHDFEAEAQSVTAAFTAAPTATFTVAGAEPEKTRYTAGFGVEMLKGENFSADVEYNYNWQDDYDAHAGALKLRWEF